MRKQIKSAIYFCIIVFSINGLAFSNETELSASETSEAQLIFALKNKDASLKTRQAAADQILSNFVRSSGIELIKILENPKESKTLQNYISKIIVDSKSSHLTELLEKKSLDSALDTYARKAVLSCLWKTDFERALIASREIVLNSRESEAIRFESIGYLGNLPGDPDNIAVIKQVFDNKKESTTFRKSAFFLLESALVQEESVKLFQKTLTDTKEIKGFRLLALNRLSKNHSPEKNEALIEILFNSNETAEMRQSALETLKSERNLLMKELPRLKNLYRMLEFGDFKESVRRTILDIETSKKKLSKNYR